jgi:hypothetical protein
MNIEFLCQEYIYLSRIQIINFDNRKLIHSSRQPVAYFAIHQIKFCILCNNFIPIIKSLTICPINPIVC